MKNFDIYFRWDTSEDYKYFKTDIEGRNIGCVTEGKKLNPHEIKSASIISNKKITEAASLFTLFFVPTLIIVITGIFYSILNKPFPIGSEILTTLIVATCITFPFSLKSGAVIHGATEKGDKFYINIKQKDLPELQKLMAEYDVKIEDKRL